MKGEKTRNKHMKFEQSKDALQDMHNFHGVDIEETLENIVAMYNWPDDGSVGQAVKFIYHLILDDGCRVLSVDKDGDKYIITFDETTGGNYGGWVPRTLTLTPRPSCQPL